MILWGCRIVCWNSIVSWIRKLMRIKFWLNNHFVMGNWNSIMKCNSMHFNNTSMLFWCISHEITGFIEITSNYYRNSSNYISKFDLVMYQMSIENASNYISKFWLSNVSNVHQKCIQYNQNGIKIYQTLCDICSMYYFDVLFRYTFNMCSIH